MIRATSARSMCAIPAQTVPGRGRRDGGPRRSPLGASTRSRPAARGRRANARGGDSLCDREIRRICRGRQEAEGRRGSKIAGEGGAARCGARDPCPRRGQTLSSDDAGAHASRRGGCPRQTPIVRRRVVSPMTGDHLFDNVRPWLARPVDERIVFIRSARWIGTPQARAAHAMLEDLLVRPPSLRTNGLMGLKPLRQRQEHDRRRLCHAGTRLPNSGGRDSRLL